MSLFFSLGTDRVERGIDLRDRFGGPFPSACWLIGGGPSLLKLSKDEVVNSPIPKMGINLAGSRIFRPNFWTSYDPTARFHRSVYLDAGIMKFVHRRRAMDLVPGTTFKVCDCPNLYFFDRDTKRSFDNFVSSSHQKIIDWADSMIQAIDILFQLGFRRIYLAGCEMRIAPSEAQIEAAEKKGIRWEETGRMKKFLKEAEEAGLSSEELDRMPAALQYHFGESKPIQAAANTDEHYFRISQYLRLSRRSMSRAGLELISVTPNSRLNDYFEFMSVEEVASRETLKIGDPASEKTVGNYRGTKDSNSPEFGPMFDFSAPDFSKTSRPKGEIQNDRLKKPGVFEDQEILFENRDHAERIRNACIEMKEKDLVHEEG